MNELYYRIGDRPIKLVSKEDGRMDVLALNWETGEFERDLSYLFEVLRPWSEAEALSRSEFDRYVADLRTRITGRAKGCSAENARSSNS